MMRLKKNLSCNKVLSLYSLWWVLRSIHVFISQITWWNQSFYCTCQFPEKWLCGFHVETFSAASSLEGEKGISWFQLFHRAPEGPWSLKVQCAGWVQHFGLFWMYHRKSGDMVRCRAPLFPAEAAQNDFTTQNLHRPRRHVAHRASAPEQQLTSCLAFG